MRALKIFLCICLAALVLWVPGTYLVNAESDLKGFIPETKDMTDAQIKPIYDEYKWYNYTFDIEEKSGWFPSLSRSAKNVVGMVFTFIISAIFLLNVLLSKLTTFLLISVYKMNVFNLIPDAINSIVLAIKKGLYDGFYEVLVCTVGIFGMVKTFRGDKTSGFKVSIAALLILGLSVVFFRNPSEFGKGLNKATEVVCANVLYQVSKPAGLAGGATITSEDDAVVLMGNHFWNIAVLKPYELLQFGEIGKYDPAEFLQKNSGSKERQDLANKYAKDNAMLTLGGVPARFGLVIFMLLIGLIYNICMLIICGILMAYQSGALFWICFAGVFFLMSLYPGNGLRILLRWMFETFGFFLQKIVLTTALSIYFAISVSIYGLVGTYGYLGVISLNIALLIYAIVNHKKIYEVIFGLLLNDTTMVNRGMQKESFAGKFAKFAVTAYTGQKLYNSFQETMAKRGRAKFDTRYKSKAEDVLTQRYNNEKRGARKDAEARLMERYTKEKQGAERRAERTGRKPEYSRFVQQVEQRKENKLPLFDEKQIQSEIQESDFVKQVDFRKSKGYTPFGEDQVNSTLNYMHKLKQEGNDPDRLTYTSVEGKSDEEIREEQKERNEATKQTQNRLEFVRKSNDKAIKKNIEGTPGPDAKLGTLITQLSTRVARKTAGTAKDTVAGSAGMAQNYTLAAGATAKRYTMKAGKILSDPIEAAKAGREIAGKVIEAKELTQNTVSNVKESVQAGAEKVRQAPGNAAGYIGQKAKTAAAVSVDKVKSIPDVTMRTVKGAAEKTTKGVTGAVNNIGVMTRSMSEALHQKEPADINQKVDPRKVVLKTFGEVQVLHDDQSLVTVVNKQGNQFQIGKKAFEDMKVKPVEEIRRKEEKTVKVNTETTVNQVHTNLQKENIKDVQKREINRTSETSIQETNHKITNKNVHEKHTENIHKTEEQMKNEVLIKQTKENRRINHTHTVTTTQDIELQERLKEGKTTTKGPHTAEIMAVAGMLDRITKGRKKASGKIERMLENDTQDED